MAGAILAVGGKEATSRLKVVISNPANAVSSGRQEFIACPTTAATVWFFHGHLHQKLRGGIEKGHIGFGRS